MTISSGWKIGIVVIVLLAGAAISAPFIAHSLVKNKIDAKLDNEFGGLAHYDQINISWSPLGATLTNLRLGDANPAAGNKPTIQVSTAEVVLDSIFDKEPHFKSATAHGFAVNISVDEKGESSLSKLVREKVPSKRTRPLTIDTLTLEGITITTFVAPKDKNIPSQSVSSTSTTSQISPAPAEVSAISSPDSVLKIATVQARGFVVPIPRQLLGYENWIATVIENVDAFDGIEMNDPGSTPCIHIARISFELDQAENTEVPVRIRKFKVEQSKIISASSISETTPGFKHVVASIQQGFGIKEPKEIRESDKKGIAPHGTGLLIEDFQTAGTVIEMRGGDASGKSAFWRLSNAKIQAANLAFGEKVAAPAPGSVKLDSGTESSSISGNASLSITELSGHYPHSSFKCSYHIENLDAKTFSSMASGAQHVDIQSGSLSMSFAGGANDGQLNIEGSVTLSEDFQISGSTTKSIAVKLTRGRPIDHVTITGTLEHPQIHLPDELAMLGELMGNILSVRPLGIVDSTIGEVPVIGSVVKETTKVSSGVLGKIPVIGGLFKKDNKDDKDKKD